MQEPNRIDLQGTVAMAPSMAGVSLDSVADDMFDLSPMAHAISTVGEHSSRLVRLNPAYQRLVGHPTEVLMGAELIGSIAVDDEARQRRMHRLQHEGSYASERAIIRHASGRPIDVQISARRVRLLGDVFDLEVFADLSAIAAEHERQLRAVETIAYLDPVTGIMSRTGFEVHLARFLSASTERRFALALVDVAGLDHIRANYGRVIAEALLNDAARRLAGELVPGEILARYGNETFGLMLLPGELAIADREQELFASLCRAFEPFPVGQLEFTLGASLGLAHTAEGPAHRNLLIALADDRMQAARSIGMNVAMVGQSFAMGM